MEQEPYNPLAKVNLGESVAEALLRAPVRSLADTSDLIGAGVYALYYVGHFSPYEPLNEANSNGQFNMPIYVGKAVPRGARKGGMTFDAGSGKSLRDRLRQHATTIGEAENLNTADFFYRSLTVDDVWIPLGENVLIERFQPLWNRVIDGFGNKTPGAGRAGSMRSQWDALHPGRKFVSRLRLAPNRLTNQQIEERVRAYFSGDLPESEKLPPEDEA